MAGRIRGVGITGLSWSPQVAANLAIIAAGVVNLEVYKGVFIVI
jgi:hypothetical protein